MDVNFRERVSVEGEPALYVSGALDYAGSLSLRTRLATMLATAARRITLDLGEVRFIDTSGLAAVVESEEELRRQGRSLVLRSCSPAVRNILWTCDLQRLLDGAA